MIEKMCAIALTRAEGATFRRLTAGLTDTHRAALDAVLLVRSGGSSSSLYWTLEELERWLAHAIAGEYHRNVHTALDMPPLTAWEQRAQPGANASGQREPAAVADPHRFLIDFLPLERGMVRRDGIALNCIHYWSDALALWIGKPEQMIVRYDPRDLSRIHLLAPNGQYYDVGYRDLSRPPISLWEQRMARKELRAKGRAFVDEAAIFRTIEAICRASGARNQDGAASARTTTSGHPRRKGGGRAGRNALHPTERGDERR